MLQTKPLEPFSLHAEDTFEDGSYVGQNCWPGFHAGGLRDHSRFHSDVGPPTGRVRSDTANFLI